MEAVATAAAAAAQEAHTGERPPGEQPKVEEYRVPSPAEKEALTKQSALLNQIRTQQAVVHSASGPDREAAIEQLRELEERYRSTPRLTDLPQREVGVKIKDAPLVNRMVHASVASTLGPAVAGMIADPRKREVHIIEGGRVDDLLDNVVRSMDLDSIEEGQQKAGELLGKIRSTKDPALVATLVSDLEILSREHGGDVLRSAEVGAFGGQVDDFAKEVETRISKEAKGKAGETVVITSTTGAEATKDSMEKRTKVAEYRAVHQRDLLGAVAEMNEVAKEAISYQQALDRIKFLKSQAAYYAITGDREQAMEKLAELTLISGSLPQEAAKQMMVNVPKTPNHLINRIEQVDRLDATGALKVVGELNKLSQEARSRGIENAGVIDVYKNVMEIRQEKEARGGQKTISETLMEERERILNMLQADASKPGVIRADFNMKRQRRDRQYDMAA